MNKPRLFCYMNLNGGIMLFNKKMPENLFWIYMGFLELEDEKRTQQQLKDTDAEGSGRDVGN